MMNQTHHFPKEKLYPLIVNIHHFKSSQKILLIFHMIKISKSKFSYNLCDIIHININILKKLIFQQY